MKFLFTPVTLTVWFFVTYLSIFYGLSLFVWIFSFHWFIVLIFSTFLTGLLSVVIYSLPILIQLLIAKLYDKNLVVLILHSMAGLLAFGYFYLLMYEHPPVLYDGVNAVSLLKGLWQESWLKSFLLMPAYLFLHLGFLYHTVITPFKIKF